VLLRPNFKARSGLKAYDTEGVERGRSSTVFIKVLRARFIHAFSRARKSLFEKMKDIFGRDVEVLVNY